MEEVNQTQQTVTDRTTSIGGNMTKKDYELLSAIFREFPEPLINRSQLLDKLCMDLHYNNCKFKKDKFLSDCNINNYHNSGASH